MCGSMVDMQSAAAEIRRGKEKDRRRNHRMRILCRHLLRRAVIINDFAALTAILQYCHCIIVLMSVLYNECFDLPCTEFTVDMFVKL